MSWNSALLKYCINPSAFPEQVVALTQDIVAIKDVYAKSKYHFLVMPRKPFEMSDLSIADVSLLQSLKSLALKIDIVSTNPKSFLMGFHAIPSMKQLHLHVISNDFISVSLKNKKHYNSFNTDFFIDIDLAISILKKDGQLTFTKEEYEYILKKPLRCLHCNDIYPNMPKLKNHLENCSLK